jgi:glucose-1-phosphate thymidylyltransferase
MIRKGILLAGGTGSRLWPITLGTSKQLLPIYDKPMIYYPLSVLMLAGIRDIAIITTPEDQPQFQCLMGDGAQWGLQLTWLVQEKPDGLAQAYLLARDFLDGAPSAMILGDNIFFGHGLPEMMARADEQATGGTVFGYHVADPERYGVAAFDDQGRVTALVEKPKVPPSSFAITGLYFLDGRAPDLAARIRPSARGELEIVDLLEAYRAEGSLQVERMGRGFAWLDTGTPGSCWTQETSFGRCKTGRGCRSARRTKSPIGRAGSTGTGLLGGQRCSASQATARNWLGC